MNLNKSDEGYVRWQGRKYCVLDTASNVLFIFVCLQFTLVVIDWFWAGLGIIVRILKTGIRKAVSHTSQQSSMHSSIVPKNAGCRCKRRPLFLGLKVAEWNKN